MIIDLRSDTFTKPGAEMLESMMNAEIGDDVFGEDPSVNQLEKLCSEMFGMEAALFCPSGTMTNQIAIKCHTQPGQEVICEKNSHVYIYEGGGIAFNSSCQVKPLEGNRGKIHASQIADIINNDDVHKPIHSLVSLENTSNRGGGSCYEMTDFHEIKAVCLKNNMKLHLDGARVWNAIVAKKENPLSYGKIFDSMSVCLSKGLGAPVGSLVLGNAAFIKQARRIRKVMGGGMRQAGYLAAAGLYALKNNIHRLETDHHHAKAIETALLEKDFVTGVMSAETNILIAEVNGRFSAASFVSYLKEKGILCIAISSTQVRMVSHLDVTETMIDNFIGIIKNM